MARWIVLVLVLVVSRPALAQRAEIGSGDQVELGADLGYGGAWWDAASGDAWYRQHALIALAIDARRVLEGAGLFALRIEGSFATSTGMGELVCSSFDCVPSRLEERIGADLGGGGRFALVGRSSARLSIDVTAGMAAAWIATSIDSRGSYRTASPAGDRGALGAYLEVRGVVQIGADVSIHAGLRGRALFMLEGEPRPEAVVEGVVGIAWVLPT